MAMTVVALIMRLGMLGQGHRHDQGHGLNRGHGHGHGRGHCHNHCQARDHLRHQQESVL